MTLAMITGCLVLTMLIFVSLIFYFGTYQSEGLSFAEVWRIFAMPFFVSGYHPLEILSDQHFLKNIFSPGKISDRRYFFSPNKNQKLLLAEYSAIFLAGVNSSRQKLKTGL